MIDGGPTQLGVALDVLGELGLSFVPTIGLAEQHELIYVPGQDAPLELPRASAALHLLERIRDEAHRFAITYHRSLRQKAALFSVLDGIDGVGENENAPCLTRSQRWTPFEMLPSIVYPRFRA